VFNLSVFKQKLTAKNFVTTPCNNNQVTRPKQHESFYLFIILLG